MTKLCEDDRGSSVASLEIRRRMLQQMAEALEDEASGLYRRAAAFEEEGYLLNREIEERNTEIQRLQLKLDSLYSERDRLLERIEGITVEASAMRDEVFNSEEAIALTRLPGGSANGQVACAEGEGARLGDGPRTASLFFNRLAPGSSLRH